MKKNILKQKIQKKNGFSLLELLVYIAILSILVVVVSNIFISISKSRGQSQAKTEVNSSVRLVTELIRQDIKNASVVSVPASAGSSGSSLTLTRGGVTIIYDVSSGVLRRKEGAATAINITNSNISVDTLTFTRIENPNAVFGTTDISIKINMTFRYNGNSPDWTYSTSSQTVVGLY